MGQIMLAGNVSMGQQTYQKAVNIMTTKVASLQLDNPATEGGSQLYGPSTIIHTMKTTQN